MRLTLVRHGETLWNRERKIQGITDVGLTELGFEQAKKLSISLQNEKFDSIITSPLKRAYDTALAIGKYHALPITVENDLHELNVGEFEGKSFPELRLKYPDFLNQWMLDHATTVLPQGESLQEVQNRVWPVIKEITKTYRNSVVVSHSFVITTILCKAQNLSLAHSKNLRIGVASKTILEFENGSVNVIEFNDTSHLQDD